MRGRWELSDAHWQLIEPPQAAHGRSRSPVAGPTSRAQRNLAAVGYRGTVARIAQQVSAVPDLPSPLPAVGAGRQTGRHLARPWKIGPGGGFHRRLLHGGKKGGLAVGPTKRGKGTKIIALADDHSLPLAVSIESASPHESQRRRPPRAHLPRYPSPTIDRRQSL